MKKQSRHYHAPALLMLIAALFGGSSVFAQAATAPATTNAAPASAADDKAALARAAQNPVASMYSLPIQFNFNGNVGPKSETQTLINVQPVIPMKVNEDWNWIHRTIIPIIDQPSPTDKTGVGNIQYQGFLTPSKPKDGLIWGVGPVIQFPTISEELGNDKWSAGPGFLVLKMQGPWVYGGLVNNIFDFAGAGDTDVNLMLINPFVNYNFKEFYLSTAPNILADWTVDSDQRWTVPLGGSVGKIFKFKGMPPMNIKVGGYYNVVHPDMGPEWQFQTQVQFLFPK